MKRLLLFLFSFIGGYLFAQKPDITAEVSSNAIKIGEQINLTLRLSYKANSGKHIVIVWPQLGDTLTKNIEVISQSKIDTLAKDSANAFEFTQQKKVIITSFEAGSWTIPALKFYVENTTDTLYTNPIPLTVTEIAVDTTKEIKDIKTVLQVNYTWKDWLRDNAKELVIGLAALIIIIVIIYFIVQHYKNKPLPPAVPEAPKVPAHITALQKLDALQNEKLWQQGKVKPYYIALADIMREYIEERFKIQALEQTTEEILIGFRNVAVDNESKNKLKQLLILSDLVKFAKEQPLYTENELSLSNAYDFINGTKREEDNNSRTEIRK